MYGLRFARSLHELAESDVEVIYIASPPALHLEHAVTCLRAGKAVLVEKPLAMSAEEARLIAAAAKEAKQFCMEAMWTRFMPAVQKLLREISHGEFGKPMSFEGSLGFTQAGSRDGALLDLGVYPISLMHAVMGTPKTVRALGRHEEVSAVMEFASGAQASIRCSSQFPLRNDAVIWAENAALELEAPLYRPEAYAIRSLPPPPSPHAVSEPVSGIRKVTQRPELRRWVQQAKELALPKVRLTALGNGFAHEAIEVNECLRNGAKISALLPIEESVAVMETVDRVRQAIGS
jgi:predicted dehydrogenase